MAKATGTGLSATLNYTVPIKKGPAMLQMSIGEWLSSLLFYVVQVCSYLFYIRTPSYLEMLQMSLGEWRLSCYSLLC